MIIVTTNVNCMYSDLYETCQSGSASLSVTIGILGGLFCVGFTLVVWNIYLSLLKWTLAN